MKTARLARNWSQAELAERSLVSGPTVHRIEQGSVAASLGTWLVVLERLGLLAQVLAM
nr:helix-turn-helix transcriptional regulator [Nitrosomonas nitrosa]